MIENIIFNMPVRGAEINVYADGVYIGDSPLGPFVPAEKSIFL